MTRCYAWPLTVGADADLQLHVSTASRHFAVRLFRVGAMIEEVAVTAGRYSGRDLPLGRPDDAWGWPRYSIGLDAALPDGVYVAVPVEAGADGTLGAVAADQGLLTRSDACLFVLRRHSEPAPQDHLQAADRDLRRLQPARRRQPVRRRALGAGLVRPGLRGQPPASGQRRNRRRGDGGRRAGRVRAQLAAAGVRALGRAVHRVAGAARVRAHVLHRLRPPLRRHAARRRRARAERGTRRVLERQMRRRILEFVDRGGNICFFAGDVACFEVELAASGDRLFCRKMNGGGPDGDGSGHDRRAVARERS